MKTEHDEVIKAKRSFQEHCKRVWAKYNLPEEIQSYAHSRAYWRTCHDIVEYVDAEDLETIVVFYSDAEALYEDHYMDIYNDFNRKT